MEGLETMNSTHLLVLASLALLVGPMCALFSARSSIVRELVDGFVLVVVTGVCLLAVMPHVLHEIGVVALLLVALGAALPTMAHRMERGPRASLGLVVLALGAIGAAGRGFL